MPDLADEGVPYGSQLTVRATADPNGTALIVIAKDGAETALTWAGVERAANRWARALQSSAVTQGAMVALSIPNSTELVVAALAAWKAGAIPIPMRWDLPDWEQQRLLEVINPALVLSETNLAALADVAKGEDDSALPHIVAPALNGICSSGSTGMPKIILDTQPALWTALKTQPFMAAWAPVPQPQTILVPAPMYHTNGFNTLFYISRRRPPGGAGEVRAPQLFLDVIERHRVTNFTATPTMLARIARVPGVHERDLSSVVWILQGAAVMPAALLETVVQIARDPRRS